MWIPPVGPEERNSIKYRLDVGDSILPAVGKDSQQSATLSHVPVDIQIIYARYTAAVAVGIIHMLYIMRALAFIASHHRLK